MISRLELLIQTGDRPLSAKAIRGRKYLDLREALEAARLAE